MSDLNDLNLNNPGRPGSTECAVRPRVAGSPLPAGASGRSNVSQTPPDDSARSAQPQPPGRALPAPATQAEGAPSGMQRVLQALRVAIPFFQKVLPVFDGHVGTAASNLLAPHPPAPPPQPRIDLAPIEDSLAELQNQHRHLRELVAEQNNSLKRVEDQLDMVREATDRNTLEQQEMMEDLKTVGHKVNVFAIVALVLLCISVVVNMILYLHIQRVLP